MTMVYLALCKVRSCTVNTLPITVPNKYPDRLNNSLLFVRSHSASAFDKFID